MIQLRTSIAALGIAATLAATAQAPGVLPGIENYESQQLRPEAPAITFMPGGEHYLMLSPDKTKIIKYDSTTGREVETIFDASHTRQSSIASVEGFTLSPDGTKLLLHEKSTPIYRYSYTAEHYVFQIARNILAPLSTQHPAQRDPVFSPDARMVAFVADNNIYLKKLDFDTETAVTTDGLEGRIINGAPDWGYDEEFDLPKCMAWAPDNSTLVYLKFNETDVPPYTLPLYGGFCPEYPQYADYPGALTYKYSLPGYPVSNVTLHSFDIDNRKTKDLALPGAPTYIPRIFYSPTDPSCLLAATLNRDQTRMELFAVNPKSTVVKSLLVEQPGAWVLPQTYQDLHLLAGSFVIFSPRSGHTHLYEYAYNGTLTRTLTSGDYDVTAYYGCDTRGNHYFTSTIDGPLNRTLSRLDLKNNLTALSPASGTATATFAPTCNYYLMGHSTASQPPVYTLNGDKLKKPLTLTDNADVRARYASAPRKEFITVPSAVAGVDLNAYIIKPSNFDPSRRYPLIVWQYSGPGANMVADAWSMGWEQYAASNGYIIACVDPRGSGARGYDFLTSPYRDLGRVETADQCAAARHLAALPYVDSGKVGIAGWSYGGYETLMALSVPSTPFTAGVAIAPVTSWNYYDAIYTERFMLTPAQNPMGYRDSAPLNMASSMNAPLLIMAGTADDNVHPANTMQYLAELQRHGKLCNLMLFPNKNHSIYGCNARDLVYSNLLHHFNNVFNK